MKVICIKAVSKCINKVIKLQKRQTELSELLKHISHRIMHRITKSTKTHFLLIYTEQTVKILPCVSKSVA